MKETSAHAVRVLHLSIGDKPVGLFRVRSEWKGLLDVEHILNDSLNGIIVDPFPNGVAHDLEKMLKLFEGKVEDKGQAVNWVKVSPALLERMLPPKPGPTPDAGPWPWVVHTAWPYTYHNPAPADPPGPANVGMGEFLAGRESAPVGTAQWIDDGTAGPQFKKASAPPIVPQDLTIETFHKPPPTSGFGHALAAAVRITHKPTGIVTESYSERSQHANKNVAYSMLEQRLAEHYADPARRVYAD